MSSAPVLSRLASYGLIIAFIIGLFFKNDSVEINNNGGNGWLFFLGIAVALIGIVIFLSKRNRTSINNFKENVEYYKIVEKYDEDPKWATYLYLKNGKEHWSYTIKGSFMAKDPENDLTFVHYTKEDAEKYSSGMFENAEQISE